MPLIASDAGSGTEATKPAIWVVLLLVLSPKTTMSIVRLAARSVEPATVDRLASPVATSVP